MKRRSILIGTLLAAALPGLVLAHGPTRQKVTLTTEVAAAPGEVWAAIGNFQDMSWHPAAFATSGDGGNEIDATRVIIGKRRRADDCRDPVQILGRENELLLPDNRG